MQLGGKAAFGGSVGRRLIKGSNHPLGFWQWIHRRLWGAGTFLRYGGVVFSSRLTARVRHADGSWTDVGLLSERVVTDAWVALLVDDLQASQAAQHTMKYHANGTGVGAEAASDTALGTETDTRATGTQTEGATANIYKSVGTISQTATRAITEHGLLSASSAGTLMDRSVFSAINVDNGDSIEFTYELTCTAGG